MGAIDSLPSGFSINKKPTAIGTLPNGFAIDRLDKDYDRLDLPEIRPFLMERQKMIGQEIQNLAVGSPERDAMNAESKNIHNTLQDTAILRQRCGCRRSDHEEFPGNGHTPH